MTKRMIGVVLFAMLTGCAGAEEPTEERAATTSNVTMGSSGRLVFERTDPVPSAWVAAFVRDEAPPRLNLGFMESASATSSPLSAFNDKFDKVTKASRTSIGACDSYNVTTYDVAIPSGAVLPISEITIVRPEGTEPHVAIATDRTNVGDSTYSFLRLHCPYTEGMTMGDLVDELGEGVTVAPLR